MNRSRVIDLLVRHKPDLVQRFGVTDLAVFGSTDRDATREASDIDILVAFDGPATSERCFGLQFYLEDSFGRRRLGGIEQAGEQPIDRLGLVQPVQAVLDDAHDNAVALVAPIASLAWMRLRQQPSATRWS